MGTDLIDGLRLSVIGLAFTFLAISFLILVMVMLQRIFPDKGEDQPRDASTKLVDDGNANEQELEELAVALAVGISLLEERGALEYQDPTLGQLLEQ